MTHGFYRLVPRTDATRAEVEAFIAKRYLDCYDAHINHFPDVLIAYYDVTKTLAAACGLRSHEEGLISDAYLPDDPATCVSRALGRPGQASDLIEFTSLAANRLDSLKHVLQAARDEARRRGKSLAIFTTTELISRILRRQKVKTIFLANADETCAPGEGPWGDYYGPGTNVYVLPDDQAYAGDLFLQANKGH